jgi:hypothetical protein
MLRIMLKRSGRELVGALILLAAMVAVAGLTRSARSSQHSPKELMYKEVLAAVRKRTPNYWRKPSGLSISVSCLDPRLTDLVYELCTEYKLMYPLRVPGGHVASVAEKFNTSSATLDWFAGRVGTVFHIAHMKCKFYEAVRQKTSSKEGGTGPFDQMVDEIPEVAGSDMEQGLRNIRSLLSNPVLAARIERGEVEFVALLVLTDGSVYIWDADTNRYQTLRKGRISKELRMTS